MEKLATIWCNYIQAARKAIRSNRYLEIRFEDLITCLEDTIAKICLFLGLEMHDSMLHYYQKSSDRLNEHVSRFQKDNSLLVSKAQRMQQNIMVTVPPRREKVGIYQKELSNTEIKEFENTAGDLLRELGYL